MSFNSQNLKALRSDLEKAFEIIGKKHNMALKVGAMSYRATSMACKIEGLMSQDGGELTNPELAGWEAHCFRKGFKQEDFGRKFKGYNGTVYTVAGIRPRNHKYPIIGSNNAGQMFKFTSNQVGQNFI